MGGIPGNSLLIIIKMQEDLNGACLHLQNSGEKSSQSLENRVNLVCFQNSCSASVSCNQQRRTPRQVSLHPFSLAKKRKKKKGKTEKPQTWQDSLETCKDSLCLCLFQK